MSRQERRGLIRPATFVVRRHKLGMAAAWTTVGMSFVVVGFLGVEAGQKLIDSSSVLTKWLPPESAGADVADGFVSVVCVVPMLLFGGPVASTALYDFVGQHNCKKGDRWSPINITVGVCMGLQNAFLSLKHLYAYTNSRYFIVVRGLAYARIPFAPASFAAPGMCYAHFTRKKIDTVRELPYYYWPADSEAKERRDIYHALYTLMINLSRSAHSADLAKALRPILEGVYPTRSHQTAALLAVYDQHKSDLIDYHDDRWVKMMLKSSVGIFGAMASKFNYDIGQAAGAALARLLGLEATVIETLFGGLVGAGCVTGTACVSLETFPSMVDAFYNRVVTWVNTPSSCDCSWSCWGVMRAIGNFFVQNILGILVAGGNAAINGYLASTYGDNEGFWVAMAAASTFAMGFYGYRENVRLSPTADLVDLLKGKLNQEVGNLDSAELLGIALGRRQSGAELGDVVIAAKAGIQ